MIKIKQQNPTSFILDLSDSDSVNFGCVGYRSGEVHSTYSSMVHPVAVQKPEYVLQRISQGEMREEKQRDVDILMKLNFIFR